MLTGRIIALGCLILQLQVVAFSSNQEPEHPNKTDNISARHGGGNAAQIQQADSNTPRDPRGVERVDRGLSREELIRHRLAIARRYLEDWGVEVPALTPDIQPGQMYLVRGKLEEWLKGSAAESTDVREKGTSLEVVDLKPSGLERFARMWKYDLEVVDTQDFLFKEDGDAESGFVALRNPENALTAHTFTLRPGGLFFVSPKDLKAAFTGLQDYDLSERTLVIRDEDFKNADDKIAYLSRTRKRDWIGRFFQSVEAFFSLRERDPVLVSENGTPELKTVTEDERTETWGIRFDPSLLDHVLGILDSAGVLTGQGQGGAQVTPHQHIVGNVVAALGRSGQLLVGSFARIGHDSLPGAYSSRSQERILLKTALAHSVLAAAAIR